MVWLLEYSFNRCRGSGHGRWHQQGLCQRLPGLVVTIFAALSTLTMVETFTAAQPLSISVCGFAHIPLIGYQRNDSYESLKIIEGRNHLLFIAIKKETRKKKDFICLYFRSFYLQPL